MIVFTATEKKTNELMLFLKGKTLRILGYPFHICFIFAEADKVDWSKTLQSAKGRVKKTRHEKNNFFVIFMYIRDTLPVTVVFDHLVLPSLASYNFCQSGTIAFRHVTTSPLFRQCLKVNFL